MTATQNIQIAKLSPNIGAEITGIDARDLDDNSFGVVRRAFLEHGMLVIRDQSLTPEQQVDFSRRWGDIFITPHLIPLPTNNAVLPVQNRGKEKTVTESWHSDSMFAERPPAITMLHSQIVPDIGGDTMFASQRAAYERLSPGMKKMVEGMRVTYVSSSLAKLSGKGELESSTHPIVRVHPETGQKALYFTCTQSARIEGMSEDESRTILQLLQSKCATPDMVYRHRWKLGDLVMWDNRCTQHYAIHDYGTDTRLLHRTTILERSA